MKTMLIYKMIKKISIFMLFVIICTSLVYSAVTPVYFNTKFEKQKVSEIKTFRGYPIYNFTKKEYFGARPRYELEKEKNYEDFRDEYIVYRRESNFFRRPVVVDSYIYDFKTKTEYDELEWETIEFEDKNEHKINLYNQYGLRYRDSSSYSNR